MLSFGKHILYMSVIFSHKNYAIYLRRSRVERKRLGFRQPAPHAVREPGRRTGKMVMVLTMLFSFMIQKQNVVIIGKLLFDFVLKYFQDIQLLKLHRFHLRGRRQEDNYHW